MKAEGMKKYCLIIKTGETIESLREAGDFENWIAAGMRIPLDRCLVCRVDLGETLSPPENFRAAIVTDSSAMIGPTRPDACLCSGWVVF